MTTKILSPLLQFGRITACATALLGLSGLVMCGSAQAAVPSFEPNTVIPGDTYSIEILGYNVNTPSGNFYAIANNLTPTFGTTQTFANSAANNQTVTVTSTETINNGIVTDSFTVSVPTTFIPVGTVDNNGNVVNALVFGLGNYYIPTGGTANPLNFNTALVPSGTTVTGALGYTGNGGGSLGLSQNPVYTNGNTAFSNAEAGQTPNGGSIAPYNPRSFTLTITYAAVPEPSTYAVVLLGAAGLCWLTIVRRRRTRA